MRPSDWLASKTNVAYAVLRAVAGALFACHGFQKLFGWFPGDGPGRAEAFGLSWWAGLIEVVCGVAISVGLFTRLAAFLASGQMAVAYFMVHARPPTSAAFFPIVNHGELAVLYSFLFLFIACRGAGWYALDGLLPGRAVRSGAAVPGTPRPRRERATSTTAAP